MVEKLAKRFYKILEVISKLNKEEKIKILMDVIDYIERYD